MLAGEGDRRGGHRSPREKCSLQVILILAMMLLMLKRIAYDEQLNMMPTKAVLGALRG